MWAVSSQLIMLVPLSGYSEIQTTLRLLFWKYFTIRFISAKYFFVFITLNRTCVSVKAKKNDTIRMRQWWRNGSYVNEYLWQYRLFSGIQKFSQLKMLKLMRKSVHLISMKMFFKSLPISFCVELLFVLNWFEKSRFQSLFVFVDRSLFWIFLWYHKVTWWWIIWATLVSWCLQPCLRSLLCDFMSSIVSSVIIWYQPIQFSIQLSIWIAGWLKPREYGWA